MERGLLWLPLLAMFIWLAWSGWNEYQKVEAYKVWAQKFERAKYDIYAVLGQRGSQLTWGKPTRKEPIDLATFSLESVKSIRLLVNGESVDEALPKSGRSIALEFSFHDSAIPINVPFTEVELANQWQQFLQRELQRLRLEPLEQSS